MKFKILINTSTIIIVAALFINTMSVCAQQTPKSVIELVNASILEGVPSLIKALGDKDYNVRSQAVEALSKKGEPAVPLIIEALTHPNSNTRKGATEVLGKIGNVTPEVVPSLIKSLVDRDIYVRKSAAEALGKIGASAMPSIIKALTDSDSYLRKGAADALGNMGNTSPEVLPALINALEDSDSNVRKSSAEALEKRSEMTEKLKIKRYIRDLGDSNSDIRKTALDALNKIGPATPNVTASIIKALDDSDYVVRKRSAEFLEKRGLMTKALKSKRYILDLKYGNKAVRMRAAETLGMIGAVTPEVVPALTNAIGEKDVCYAAIEALGNIGPAAKSAVPSLIKALNDSNINVRTEAARALGNIGTAKDSVPSLIKALRDSDSSVRASAAGALEKLGAMTAGNKLDYLVLSHPILSIFAGICVCLSLLLAGWFAVPVVRKVFFPVGWYMRELNNPDREVRVSAAHALAKIGKPAVSLLIKALGHKNSDIRINAAEALNEIAELPPRAIHIILKSLRDKESEVRRIIVEVLGKNGHEDKDVIPALIKVLDDKDSDVRASAAEALGKLGASSPEVIPALMKAFEDSYYLVRDNASVALGKCGAMTVDLKVKRFITDLGDNHKDISSRGAAELNNIGTPAILELIKALEDGNSNVRRFAASFLEKHKALTVEHKVKRYILDLSDSHPNVRTKAAEALGNMGPAAAEATPLLIKLIGNNDYYIRLHASKALEKIGSLSPELKAKQYSLDLRDSNRDVRRKAAEALCILGQNAKEALPNLKKLLTDEDETVRIAAEKAVHKIENDPLVTV